MNGQILQHSGEGDAAILSSAKFDTGPIERGLARRGHREAAALKAKQDQDKAFAEELKWNPGKAWYFHTDELNGKVKNVFDLQTQIHQGDNSPETARKLRDAKWDAETMAKQSQNIQQLYPQLQNQIDQGLDKYEDKALVKTKLNDEVLRKGSVNDFDFEKASDIKGFTGSDTFKDREWAVDFAKSIPELVQSHITKLGNEAINDKEIKSKFYELDVNGNPKRAADGTAILKDSPEVLTAMKQEPRVVKKATDLVEAGKYKTVDEALRDEYIRPYASSQVRESQTAGRVPKKIKKEEVILTHQYDTEENTNLGDNAESTGKTGVVPSYSPHEIRIGGTKSETPINVSPKNLVDPNTNSEFKNEKGQALVGDRKVTIARLRMMPYYLDGKNKDRVIQGTQSEIEKIDPNTIGYRWYAYGTMPQKDEDGHTTDVQVRIPYEQVKGDLDTKRGINLDKRTPEEFTDAEIKSIIRTTPAYKNLTPEEKAMKFLQFRGKK